MMGSSEDRNAMTDLLIVPYRSLYLKSPEFHAWVNMQAALVVEQRELVAHAFESQLRERGEELHAALTDVRPRMFTRDENGETLRTWVLEHEVRNSPTQT